MAEEFIKENGEETQGAFREVLEGVPLAFAPHESVFKRRVPDAIGLIRTGDTTQYANIVIKSA